MIVVLYLFDVFSPNMQTPISLLSLDLESGLKVQSGGSFLKQIFWITSLSTTLLLCHIERVALVYKPKLVSAFICVLVIVIFSTFWSDYPAITIKRACFQLIFISTLYFASLLLKTRENLIETLYFTLCIILIFELFFLLFIPHLSFAYSGEFRGIHYSKNSMGVVASLGFIISLDNYYKLKSNKRFSYSTHSLFATFFWAIILLLSQSKTCLLLTAIVTLAYISRVHALFLFFLTRKLAKSLNLIFLFLLVSGLVIFNDFTFVYSVIFSSIDLTGRGMIWGIALDSISHSPVLGSGYGAFWGVGKVPELFNIQYSFLAYLNQAHNGYIDVCLQIGVLGLIIFMYFIQTIASALKYVKSSRYILWSLFLFTLLHNLTESSFLRDSAFSWFILIIVILSVNLNSADEQLQKNSVV